MRKRKKQTKLSRSASHRDALLRNLSQELIRHGQIKTTLPKAKALRPFVEPLITHAKNGKNSCRDVIKSTFYDQAMAKVLLEEIGPRYAKEDRKGGYTRIIKIGKRQGDGAEEAIIQLVTSATPDETEAKENNE